MSNSRDEFDKWANEYCGLYERDVAWGAWQASRAWKPIDSAPLGEIIICRDVNKKTCIVQLNNKNLPADIIEWQSLPE